VPSWTDLDLKIVLWLQWRSFFWKNHFLDVRRFEDGFGTNFGRPRCQNDPK
jgi:hypothetical protein